MYVLFFKHHFMVISANNLFSDDKQGIGTIPTINRPILEQPPKFQLKSEDILIQYQRMFHYDVYTPPTPSGIQREIILCNPWKELSPLSAFCHLEQLLYCSIVFTLVLFLFIKIWIGSFFCDYVYLLYFLYYIHYCSTVTIAFALYL